MGVRGNDTQRVAGAQYFEHEVQMGGNTGLTPGSGFSEYASFNSWVETNGNVTITHVLVDLTGIRSTAANDVIGDDGQANAYIGQYDVSKMGTFFAASIQCLEAPAGGDPDINLASADEDTLAEDGALSGGTNPITIINSGDHTAGGAVWGTTAPNSDKQFLYLVAGAATDADYTAGVLHIKIYGTN